MATLGEQATQCPRCKTAFEVTTEQLAIGNGKVRCGACLQIFLALDHRVNILDTDLDEYDERDQFELIDPIEDDQNEDDSIYGGLEVFGDLDNLDDIDPPRLTDKQTAIITAQDQDLLDHWDDNLPEIFDDFSLDTPEEISKLFDDLEEDNDWAADILTAAETVGAESQFETEPTFDNPSSINLPELGDDFTEESSLPAATKAEVLPLRQEEDYAKAVQDFNNDISKNAIEPEAILFKYGKDGSPWARWGLLAAAVLLLLTLATQYAWNNQNQLTRYPQLRPILETTCRITGCELPILKDISKIKKQDLLVKPHLTAANGLTLTMIITNNAVYQQPWPHLYVAFSNLQGKPVAWRTFAPSEYLDGELKDTKLMPSGNPIYITLDLANPSDKPLGYQIKLVHP